MEVDNERYLVLNEDVLVESDRMSVMMGDEDNNFAKLLSVGAEFKSAGLTPVYVLDTFNMDIICSAKEMIGKKLH